MFRSWAAGRPDDVHRLRRSFKCILDQDLRHLLLVLQGGNILVSRWAICCDEVRKGSHRSFPVNLEEEDGRMPFGKHVISLTLLLFGEGR